MIHMREGIRVDEMIQIQCFFTISSVCTQAFELLCHVL